MNEIEKLKIPKNIKIFFNRKREMKYKSQNKENVKYVQCLFKNLSSMRNVRG